MSGTASVLAAGFAAELETDSGEGEPGVKISSGVGVKE
jgi:hypothetical protein